MKQSEQVFKDISSFLHTHGIMTLATIENGKPWTCTVYYGVDKELNLYIVTNPKTRHGKNFKLNPNVAFAIFDSSTKVTDSKKGVQGQGVCELVSSLGEIAKGLALWHGANPGIEGRITLEVVKKIADAKVFKIKPSYIKFFDKDLYGKKEFDAVEL